MDKQRFPRGPAPAGVLSSSAYACVPRMPFSPKKDLKKGPLPLHSDKLDFSWVARTVTFYDRKRHLRIFL